MKTQEKYYFLMYRVYIIRLKEVVGEKDRVLFFSSEFEREEYARYLNRCEKIEDFKEIKPLSSMSSMQTAFVEQCMSPFRSYL